MKHVLIIAADISINAMQVIKMLICFKKRTALYFNRTTIYFQQLHLKLILTF